MGKYVAKRLVLMLFTFFVIFTICFFLIKALPNPIVVGPGTDKEIEERRFHHRLEYPKPSMARVFVS